MELPYVSVRTEGTLSVDGPPIADGLVVVAKGRIEAVVTAPDCENHRSGRTSRLSREPVSAHVHLEFSGRSAVYACSSPPIGIPRVLDHRARRGEANLRHPVDGIGKLFDTDDYQPGRNRDQGHNA